MPGEDAKSLAAAAALEAASARPVQDPSASARRKPVAADINGQASGVKPSPRGSHERRRAAGSMQLTPEQQKVAAAFLVVMKRALMTEDAAALVETNLASNNSAMSSLLDRLSKGTAMLSLASFGRNAPSKMLDSLTLLAEQCTAAGCQPLAVLTWSAQCDTHRKCMTDKGSLHERLRLLDNVADSLGAAQDKRIEAGQPTGNITALVKLGVSQNVAALVACFLNTFRMLHREDAHPEREQRADLDHMLPGAVDVLASNVHADWTHGDVLHKLVPPIESALQAYKDRAGATGQSYKHVVMLQAAVQGWTHSPHVPQVYLDSLLGYIIAAEPPAASVETPPASDSRPSLQHLKNGDSAPVEGSKGSAAAAAPTPQAIGSQDAAESSAASRGEPQPPQLPLHEAQPGTRRPQLEPSGKPAAAAQSSEPLGKPGAERAAAASLKGVAAAPESAPVCFSTDQAVHSDVAPPAAPPQPEPGGPDADTQAPEDAGCPSSSHHDDRAAASWRFTPEQRKVAAALMVVLKRAMRDGAEAMLSVKKTLVSNNYALTELLITLPFEGPLPSLRAVEEGAPSSVLESLSLLAEQCAAAGRQPLEVIQWSAQCATNKAAYDSIASQGMHRRLQLMHHLGNSLIASAESRGRALEALVQLGFSSNLAYVTAKVVNIIGSLHGNSVHPPHRSDVDHMLPGVIDIMIDHVSADWSCAETLRKLVPPIESALQAYKDRAVADGHSFEHVIMLQAAAQGWTHGPLDVLRKHLNGLIKAMIKAEPPLASLDSPVASEGSTSDQALSAASLAVEAPAQGAAIVESGENVATTAQEVALSGRIAPASMPAAAGEPAQPAGQGNGQIEAPVVLKEAERADRRRAKKQRQKAARANAQEPKLTQAQVEGREAAGSLHAGQSECSNMTRQVPLQPATTGPLSLEPAVSSHAVVAAAGPKTPEQGPDLSAPVTAHGAEALMKKRKGKKGKPAATEAVQEDSTSAGRSARSPSSSASARAVEEERPATEAQQPVQDAVGSRGFLSALRPDSAGSAASQSVQQASQARPPDQAQGCRPQSAQAAQGPAPEEEPWQKVRSSSRKSSFPKPSPREARMAHRSGGQLPDRAVAAAQPAPQPGPSPPSPDELPMPTTGQPAADSTVLWPPLQAAAAAQFSSRGWPAASHAARQSLQQQQQQPEAVTLPRPAQPAAEALWPALQAASQEFPARRLVASHAAPQPVQPELVRPPHPAEPVDSGVVPQQKITTSAVVHVQQQGLREPALLSPDAIYTVDASSKCSEQQPGAAVAAPPSDWEDGPDGEECCVVCWVQLREVLFLSCGHMCACQRCANNIMEKTKECPMCRTTIESTIVVRF